MALGYILDPFIQVNTIIGTPVVGAKIYVYKANTSNLAITYSDFEGHTNTNPVRTNTLGNCTIIAEDNTKYDIEIRDAMNLLLMSKKDISVVGTSGESSDTSVEPGYGIEVTRSENTFTISVDTDLIATKEDLNDKQDKMHAGDNIEITRQNYINVVNRREIISQYPVKMDRGNNKLKIYIDEEYLAGLERGTDPVSAGIDLVRDGDVIGVNTNSTISGDWNFVAGYENNLVGDYNAGFGIHNDVNGDRNFIYGRKNTIDGYSNFVGGTDNYTNGSCNIINGLSNSAQHGAGLVVAGYNNIIDECNYSVFAGHDNDITFFNNGICLGNDNSANAPSGATNAAIIGSYNKITGTGYGNDKIIGNENNVSGSSDYIIGNNNGVSGNNKYVFGNNNTANGSDYMYVFGHATSGIEGGLVLGVEGHNNFEIRKNDDIYYRYNGNMIQLRPLERNGFSKLITISHVITNDDITNHGFSETLDFSQYNTWLSSGLLTSIPMVKVQVFMMSSQAVDTDIFISRNNTYDGSYNTPWIYTGNLIQETQFLETEYTVNDPTITRRWIEIKWSNIATTVPAVGTTVYIHYSINAIKLI